MRQAVPVRAKTKVFHLNIKRRVEEGLSIVLLAMSLYVFLSLITYHTGDPSWSHAVVTHRVLNAGGTIGAFFSDIFLYLFGVMAYLLPVFFAISAWFLLKEASEENAAFHWSHELLRFCGLVMALAAGCGLIDLHWASLLHAHVPFNAGGILGEIVSRQFVKVLNTIGTAIVLVSLGLAGFTWLTGVSWIVLSKKMVKGVVRLWQWLLERDWTCWFTFENKEEKPKRERAPLKVNTLKRVIHECRDKVPLIIEAQKPIQVAEKNIEVSPAKKTSPQSVRPDLSLLDFPHKSKKHEFSQARLEELSRDVELKLFDFGIEAKVTAVHPGPVVTRFELELAPGIKVSKITSLAKDLARALSQTSVRVVEVIPGKSVIGLEIPNEYRELICLRELLESSQYVDSKSAMGLALGKDIAGYSVVVDLEKMPHLLVAGTTGSGKSVGLNAMILSLLFKKTPDEVRFIMVDPKMLELSVYDGIPHLLTPVVTDMKEAANAFRWCVAEMERRYRWMASLGVRNLQGFNAKVSRAIQAGQPIVDPLVPDDVACEGEMPTLKPLPYIVVVVDELADMMMVVGKKVEELIARIAQKARAAGIHMILATQRPSVDVITGLIKANIPTRISFQVSSRIDSRTILDQQGAEQLLGYGDMLYLPPGTSHPVRIHGAFISDEEVHRVVAGLKKTGCPAYLEEVIKRTEGDNGALLEGSAMEGELDPLYDQAVQIIVESRRASISYLQRRLRVGYNRAASILESMEAAGVVSPMETNGAREVLAPPLVGEEE